MPYELTLPDGSIVPGVPDDLSRDAALARARQAYPDAFGQQQQQQAEPGGLALNPITATTQGARSGIAGAYGRLRTATTATLGGSDEDIRESAHRTDASREGLAQVPGFGTMSQAWSEAPNAVEGAWGVLRQVPAAITGNIAQSLPEMAIPAVGGYAAAQMAARFAQQAPWLPVKAIGYGVAALLAVPGFFGGNLETQVEVGDTERTAGRPPPEIHRAGALAAAVLQGAVDPALAAVLGAFGREEAHAVVGSYLRAGGRGTLRGGVTEMPAEIVQEIAQRAQAGQDLLSDDALKAYAEAGTAAFLVGGTLGGGERVWSEAGGRARATATEQTRREVEQTERAAQRTAGQQQLERDADVRRAAEAAREQERVQEAGQLVPRAAEEQATQEAAFRARALTDQRPPEPALTRLVDEQGTPQIPYEGDGYTAGSDYQRTAAGLDLDPRQEETPEDYRARLAAVANVDVRGPVQVVPDRNGWRMRNDQGQLIGRIFPNAETAGEFAQVLNERIMGERTQAEAATATAAEPAALARAAQQATTAPQIPLANLPPPVQQTVRMARARQNHPNVDAPTNLTELRDIAPDVADEVEAKVRPDVAGPQGIPAFVTNQQRSRLRDLGYSPDQIREMPPEEVHRRLGTGQGPTVEAPLPEGTFTPQQYDDAIAAVRRDGKVSISKIIAASKAKPAAARGILEVMVQRGEVKRSAGSGNTYKVVPVSPRRTMQASPEGQAKFDAERAAEQAAAEAQAQRTPQGVGAYPEPMVTDATQTRDEIRPQGFRPRTGFKVDRTDPDIDVLQPLADSRKTPPLALRALEDRLTEVQAQLQTAKPRAKKALQARAKNLTNAIIYAENKHFGQQPAVPTPVHPAIVAEQQMEASHAQVKADLLATLKKRLADLGIKPEQIKLFLAELGPRREGNAFNNIIRLAYEVHGGLSNPQIAARLGDVLNHEVIHVFKNLGLIKPNEWSALVREAKRTKHPNLKDKTFQQAADEHYSHLKTKEDIEEEAVAEMFRYWARDGKLSPAAQGAFSRIIEFFKRVGRALVGRGYQTAESVFKALEKGTIGARPEGSAAPIRTDVMPTPPGAQPAHTTTVGSTPVVNGQLAAESNPLVPPVPDAGGRDAETTESQLGRFSVQIEQVPLSTANQAHHQRVFAQPAVQVPGPKRGLAKVFADGAAWLRANLVDMGDAILRQERAEAARTGREMPTADLSAYAARQQAERDMASFEDMMRYGGAPTVIRPSGAGSSWVENNRAHKALKEMIRPIMHLEKQAQMYMAAKRAFFLDADMKQHPLTQAEIQAGLALGQQHPEIVQFDKEYQAFNKDLMQFAVDTGVITQAQADAWTQHASYYPFYRQLAEVDGMPRMRSPTTKGMGSELKVHKLKGQPGIPLAEDMFQAILQNVQFWNRAGLTNLAAQKAADLAIASGIGNIIAPRSSAAAGGSFFYRDQGKTVQVYVDDKNFVDSMKGLELDAVPMWMRWLGWPARLLREMVTRDPAFMLGSNLIRDTFSAFVINKNMRLPVIGTVKGLIDDLRNTTSAQALRAMGGAGGYEYQASSKMKGAADSLRRDFKTDKNLLRVGTPAQLMAVARKAWEVSGRVAEASDMATRNAIYEATLKRTGNKAQAAYEAIMSMPFHRKGKSQVVRMLTTMIPFLNARLQGMDVLWHGGLRDVATLGRGNGVGISGNSVKNAARFMLRGTMLSGIALTAMGLAQDDDDYAQIDDYIRDSNVLIPLRALGLQDRGFLSIPKPFEIGALFQTIPEHIVRYMGGQESGPDVAKMFLSQFAAIFGLPTYPGSPIPMPQAFAPLAEIGANKSSFTGRPIIPRSEENLPPEQQFDTRTSAIAKLMGNIPLAYNTTTGQWHSISPRIWDHMLRGYGGTIGGYLLGASTYLINTARDEPPGPAGTWSEMAGARRFLKTPDNTSLRTVSEFYEVLHNAQEAQRGVNRLTSLGMTQEALQSYRENARLIGSTQALTQTNQVLTQLRQRENMIRNDRNMDPERKQEALQRIREMRVTATRNIDAIRRRTLESP